LNKKQLKQYLERLSHNLKTEDQEFLSVRLKSLKSVFPFNEYEYVLMFLLDREVITFRQYEDLREQYVSSNPYLELYSLAPRVFGQIWAHQHIIDIDSRFQRPSKELDPNYDGQYDLWIEGVKVEAKASRAIATKKRGNLLEKALRYESEEPFWMNFQQIKIDMADVFIFIGVWVDRILYWVMSQKEVKESKYLSHQHRGGIEFQVGITPKNISEFERYRVEPDQLAEVALRKGKEKEI